MKAYEINQFGIDNLSLVERDDPQPKPNEVVVKFRAASLNFRDLMMVGGKYNPKLKMPLIPLSDGAGEVIATGASVTRWKTGDRVCPIFMQSWIEGEPNFPKARTALGGDLDGVLREYGAFPEESLVKIPANLSFEEAATLPCAAVTAWNALSVSGKLTAGETVLTQGTGGVSIFAVQFARVFGAKIIATSSSDEKLQKVKELGAGETINYKQTPDWDRAVLDLTDKKGVDHVIEVGGPGTLPKSLAAVKIGGHVALIGVLTGAGEINPTPILMKSIRLQGIYVGSRHMFEAMNRAIEQNGIKPVIDQTFAFEEAREAYRYMESAQHFGKIVVKF